MSRSWFLLLAAGLALSAGRLAVPGAPWPLLIVAFATACAAGFVVSVRRGLQPRLAWSAFAVAVFFGGLTNGLWAGGNPVFPRAVMDVLDLAGYAAGAIGMASLLRRVGGADPDVWLDASVAGIVVGMLVWEFLLVEASPPGGVAVDVLTSTLVAVFDTIVFIGIARFVIRPVAGRAVTTLVATMGVILAVDASYYAAARLAMSDLTYEAMWLVGYAVWASLALHPQISNLVQASRRVPTAGEETSRSIRGILLQGTALTVGPLLLWWHAQIGEAAAAPTLIVGSLFLAGLVTARLGRLVQRLVRETHALREARAAAEERERFVGALVEQSPVGIEVFDAAGISLRRNDAKRAIVDRLAAATGRPPGPPNGRVTEDAYLLQTGHGPLLEQAFSGATVAQPAVRVPLTAMGADEDIWLQQTCFPLKGPDGGLQAVISFTEDVTAAERADKRRRAVETKLRESAKLEALGVLAGGIAHDFNNLLVAILGHASFARTELEAGSPAVDDLAAVEIAARRAADLAHQMLAYSGRASFVVAPVRMEDLVREMGDLVGRSVGKNVTLRSDFAPDLPLVQADATQLRQVILNLIINASDALEGAPGTVSLRTALVELAADDPDLVTGTIAVAGSYVMLEVTDTGCGMEEATIGRIFDPFFTTKQSGRGLGLAATLGIVKGHAGALRVHSAPGVGTRFQILLRPAAADAAGVLPDGSAGVLPAEVLPDGPAADARPGAVPTAEPTSPQHRSVHPRPTHPQLPDGGVALPVARGRILVVDDEESVRHLAGRVLSAAGFTIASAHDGPEALAAFAAEPAAFGGVLLDVTLPTLDGVAVLDEMRRIRPDVRVVLTSGWAAEEVAQRLGATSGVEFLQKPYGASSLVAAFA